MTKYNIIYEYSVKQIELKFSNKIIIIIITYTVSKNVFVGPFYLSVYHERAEELCTFYN